MPILRPSYVRAVKPIATIKLDDRLSEAKGLEMTTLKQSYLPPVESVLKAKDAEIERLTAERDQLFTENGAIANTLGADNLRLRAALQNMIAVAHQEGNFVTRGMQEAKEVADAALRLNQQLRDGSSPGLLPASMTVLSECQDGPPSEQAVETLRAAVEAALRDS